MCTFPVHLICFNVKSKMCTLCMHRYTCTHPRTYYLAVQEVGNPRSRCQRAWFLLRPDLRFAVGCLARSSHGLLCSDSFMSSLQPHPLQGWISPGPLCVLGKHSTLSCTLAFFLLLKLLDYWIGHHPWVLITLNSSLKLLFLISVTPQVKISPLIVR